MNELATDRPQTRAWRKFWQRCVLGFALLGCVAVYAADDSKIIFPSGSPHAAAPTAASPGGGTGTVTFVVAILLAGVGGWMVWRNRRGPSLARGAQNLAIEETKSLGNRQYLVVASYDGNKYLLGVCPGRIDMLAPIKRRGEEDAS